VADPLWALAGLGAASMPLAAGLAAALARRRRRRAERAAFAAGAGGAPGAEHHLPPTIEAAELGLAVLLRRMRAHLRDPHDYAASRIAGEAAFEDCLDRAAALGARIAELGGAAPEGPAGRERTRGLILEGLMAEGLVAGRRTAGRVGGGAGTRREAPAPPPGARARGPGWPSAPAAGAPSGGAGPRGGAVVRRALVG
jgi:hypothetical protein